MNVLYFSRRILTYVAGYSVRSFFPALFVFCLLFIQESLAEGSRDLYPSGAQGYRAYLMSTETSQNWNPFATPGTMRVWVQPGEVIYAGSSVHGFRRHTMSSPRVGEIVLRSPDGHEYRSLSSADNPLDGGLIRNRDEELAGPNTGSVAGGYEPFTRTVGASEGGIWEISFISLGDNTNIPSPSVSQHPTGSWNGISYNGNTYNGNYAADAQWVQPLAYGSNNHVALIAAWDVSVGSAGNASRLIPGRLFTTVFAGTLPNGLFSERAFYSKFYVLTPGGYAFLVDNNGQNGASFNFFSNDKGIHVNGQPGTPSYQSLNSSTLANLQTRTRDPRLPDATELGSSNVTNKLFFNKPASDLPGSAPVHYGINNTTTTTWLKNQQVVPPAITDVNLACGGTITFNSNVSGGYKILIDVDQNGDFNDAVDRVLTGTVTAGIPVEILWDGKNGTGANVEAGAMIKIQVDVTAGEIHFPFSDVESNREGIIIGQLSADGNYEPTGNYTVYWDDSNIGSTPANTVASNPLFNNADGVDSRANGHKWAGTGNTESSFYGNNRTIDTWSYVRGSSEIKEIITCGLSISGYVFNDVDGLDDGLVDNNNGREAYPLPAGTLHATLMDGNTALATIPIDANGQYQFGGLLPNTNYTVVLSTTPGGTGAGLPDGWRNTGEFVGTTIGNDGNVNGILNVPVATTSVANANFGIQYKLNISGNVWHDVNGDAGHNGTEKPVSGGDDDNGGSSSLTGGILYVNLVDADNRIVDVTEVESDGTYRFENVSGGAVYKVILSKVIKTKGTVQLDNDASIPDSWQATGVNTKVEGIPTPDTGNKTNVISLGMVLADVTDVNFGIQLPPLTDDSAYELDQHPGPGALMPLDGTVAASGDKGETEARTPIASDLDGTTFDFVITGPVTTLNGTATGGTPVLFYNGLEVNETNFPGLRIPSYDPDLLSVEVNGVGYKGVSFDFKVIDEAGVESNISNYRISWPDQLPVKWRSIGVQEENGLAVLSWATTEEMNVSHFEVLFSADAATWQPVGKVGAENRAAASYRYVHGSAIAGIQYFRVRSVDFDGSSSLSSIVSLKQEGGTGIRLYPNPVTGGELTLDLPAGAGNHVTVYNLTGIEVMSLTLKGNVLNVRSLATGQYILRVTGGAGQVVTRPFLVK